MGQSPGPPYQRVGADIIRPVRHRAPRCHSERSEESVLPSLAPSLRELPPQAAEGVFLFRTKDGGCGFFGLRPQNDKGGDSQNDRGKRGVVRRAGSSRPTQRRTTSHPRHSERSEESVLPSLAPSLRELPPQAAEGVFLFRTKTGDADSSACGLRMTKGETVRMTEGNAAWSGAPGSSRPTKSGPAPARRAAAGRPCKRRHKNRG